MTRFIGLMAVLILAAGCSQSNQQTGDVSESTTPVSFNTAGAPTVEFNVPDMMCPDGCGAKVKEILSQQPGAKDVSVDFPNKTATVAVDKEKFDTKQAIAALVDHQFNHSTLKSADSTATSATPQTAKAPSTE
jgi:copper chaperone CopZ